MGWIQLLVGAIALAREIVKVLQEKQDCKADQAKKVKDMRLALRRAREEGKVDDVEEILRSLSVRAHHDDSDQLQNK